MIVVGKNGKGSIWEVNKDSLFVTGKRYSYKGIIKRIAPPLMKVIRFGYVGGLLVDETAVYNAAAAIKRASNKRVARKIMKRSGVHVPDIVEYECPDFTGGKKWIGRPDYHHGGQDLYVIEDYASFTRAVRGGCTHYNRFYPKKNEYRVHVAHGKVLLIARKVRGEGVAWNRAVTGDPFEILGTSEYVKKQFIMKAALAAVDALGLDFGAVDIMANPEDETMPKCAVLEVNTAPSLSGEYTPKRYREYFDAIMAYNGMAPHFDWHTYERGVDYWMSPSDLAVLRGETLECDQAGSI